jgi:hypothetical protein
MIYYCVNGDSRDGASRACVFRSFGWRINHSIAQSLNRSITQSLNHSIAQSLNHSITQCLSVCDKERDAPVLNDPPGHTGNDQVGDRTPAIGTHDHQRVFDTFSKIQNFK